MNFYRIVDTAQESRDGYVPHFKCTVADAHDYAKTTPKVSWPEIRIELVDIETDKESVCAILNHEVPNMPMPVRTWAMSPRGALVVVENGE